MMDDKEHLDVVSIEVIEVMTKVELTGRHVRPSTLPNSNDTIICL